MGMNSLASHAASVVLPVALAFGAATADAQSLEPGKCYTKPAVESSLKVDKQNTIALGNRITDHHPVNIFTSNAAGTLGYNLEGDKPFGTPSVKICVGAMYKNVRRLSDPNDPTALFSAHTYKIGANGNHIMGKELRIVPAPDNLASVFAVDASGTQTPLMGLRDFRKTQHLDAIPAQPTVIATTTADAKP